MTIIHVYVGEKLIGSYPDCLITVGPEIAPYIYVLPKGTDWDNRNEKYVCAFPIANTNMSAIAIRQDDKK
jgi:hypothetical protein